MSRTASSLRTSSARGVAQRVTDRPLALGAHLRDGGVDVAVVASHATAVDLCLLDEDPSAATGFAERRYALRRSRHGVWQGHVPGVGAGQRYGFRVHGRWDPRSGLRHNPAKLLLDPYARGVAGDFHLAPEVFGHAVDEDLAPVGGWQRNDLDSAGHVRHGVILDDVLPVPADSRPHVPWESTVIYEAHVRGLTRQLPGVPEHLRGTYAGLAHPTTIAHLRSLGVTAVELLPIHAMGDEPFLLERGLTNYWGYNTLGFLAPEPSYATRAAQEEGPAAVLDEVRGMVHLLHEAGIEVLLDVVYNHTCEGGDGGPTLSWRGLDNTEYYMHDGVRPAHMVDVTGTGNSLDFRRTRVVQLTLDSLRYWVKDIGVDGFRFDLATTLGRNGAEFTAHHPFFVALATDPVLSQVKLIAEPWDVGPGGWRTGEFPAPMADWNDRFRNAVRTFWLSDPATGVAGGTGEDLRELATRLAGSADLFARGTAPGGRGPLASINYVTAHDGFTLADLVTYNLKHNEANTEDNRDGSDDNRSWNHGVEGPVEPVGADDPRGGPGDAAIWAGQAPRAHERGGDILIGRRRSMRNVLGTLLLSAGTPMITAGDELGRSQFGNNNAYCQDNEISWVDWELRPWQEELLATTQHLLHLRREHPVLHPDVFANGHTADGDVIPDLSWYRQDAAEMDPGDWHNADIRVLQMLRSGWSVGDCDALLVLNGSLDEQAVTLPEGAGADYVLAWDSVWERPDDTAATAEALQPGARTTMEPLTLRLYLARR
ncbi:glycogen debranching protein GlgX [Georgenia sp. H159]|uniref:glycogen debranching protein GlgX n=1 Tax=Georgenia sp. H159 TaxID=3076115 RepID=UPI002D779862|nr:glycogen debranching protein GlgX [Georgenia sp. H159]